jgi:hypothetical protein
MQHHCGFVREWDMSICQLSIKYLHDTLYWRLCIRCLSSNRTVVDVRGVSKSSRTRSKKTCSILAANSLKTSLLGNVYSKHIIFPYFKSTIEVIFLNAVKYHLPFALDVIHCFKMPLQFHFRYGKQSELQIKVRSSLAFSHSSRHKFMCHCFRSFVKSRGTYFVAMRCMFKLSTTFSWQTP